MGAIERVETPVEFDRMDDDTRQLFKSLEDSLHHQLRPMEQQLQAILAELNSQRDSNQKIAITVALLEERMADQKADLNKGLAAVRSELDKGMSDRTKVLGQAFAVLGTLTAILIGLATWYLKGGS